MDMTLLKTGRTLFTLYISRYRRRVLAGSALALLFASLSLTSPFFTRIFLDDIILSNRSDLLKTMLLVMMGVVIIGAGLDLLYNYVLVKAGQRINLDIKFDFFRRLMVLPLNFFRATKQGEINYRLFADTDVIQRGLVEAIVNLLVNGVLAVVITGILLVANWQLALIVLAAFLIQGVATWKFHEPIRRYALLTRRKGEEAQAFALERIEGIELIRAYGSERRELRQFHRYLHNLVKMLIRSFMISKGAGIVVHTTNTAWAFLVLWYGTHQVLSGALTIGALMSFIILSQMLYPSIATIINTLLGLQDVSASVTRFFEVYSLLPVKEPERVTRLSQLDGHVTFERVSFGYAPPALILDNVSFTVNPGEIIAVVGKSGVGKSTMLSLIPRFYDPLEGRILLDDQDVRQFRLRDLRRHIGIVLQGSFTFSGTVRENLTYGLNDLDDERITDVLTAGGVYEFIASLPAGYDTQIGERGVLVSKGEAQLIAFSRLLLQDPSIVILDEPTSFLDLQTESFVNHALETLMRDRTIFIIAHRLSTIRQANRILLLDRAKITEFGSVDDLMLSHPRLFQLHREALPVGG